MVTTGDPSAEEQYPGLNEAVAQAVREALAAGAMAAPLEAPPSPALTMAITPKLGLKQPALDDPALVTDLNDNMTILDNAVTATSVATLTNKTLTAPIITNPTITGWTNAQHSHLDAAGAGQLDGGAIVSGDIGTGFVVRETYVQDYLNAGPDLVDATVRDTLWWGPIGAGVEDTSLKRTAARVLQTNSQLVIAPDGGTITHYGLSVAFPKALTAYRATSSTGSARVGQMVGPSPNLWLTSNADYNGTAWNRDDVAKFAYHLSLGTPDPALGSVGFSLLAAAPGANPITAWQNRLQVNNQGDFVFTADSPTQTVINALGVVRVQGNNVQIGPAGNNPSMGGRVIYNNDSGALHWSTGLLATPGNRDFSIYDFVRGAQVFRINATDGAISVVPINQSTAAITASGNIIAQAENTGVAVRLGSAYSRAGVYSGSYMDVTAEGAVTVKSLSGGIGLTTAAGGNIVVTSSGTYLHPTPDGGVYLGHPSYRYQTIYVVAAPVVGSSLDLKEDISPLDAEACVASVLATDWVDYAYKAPAPPDRGEGVEDKDWDAQMQAYQDMLVETAAGRRQKGYILDSPDHAVGDQFGLPDRKNRSDGADLAVVACALQQALKRVAALEDEVAALAAQA